jgi:hypothetical protein
MKKLKEYNKKIKNILNIQLKRKNKIIIIIIIE